MVNKLITQIEGVDLYTSDDIVILSSKKTGGRFEPETMDKWKSLCSNLSEDDIILDVGAYTGIYGLVARSICNSTIFSFEPNPVTYNRLNENVILNFSEEVERFYCKNIAAGSDKVSGKLKSNFLRMSSGCQVDPNGTIDIQISPLDTYTKRASLVKIDVEGYECEVLLGMDEILSSGPIIIIECLTEKDLTEVSHILSSYNYILVDNFDIRNYMFMVKS